MYSKLALAFVAALAVVVQADDSDYSYKNGTSPYPSGSGPPLLPGTGASASQVASSAPFPISTGGSLSAGPLNTGAPIGTGTSASGSSPTSAGKSEDTTLTYTIGTGTSATVITTTIRHTIYQTNSASIASSADAAEASSKGKSTRYRTIQSTIYVSSQTPTGSGGESTPTDVAGGAATGTAAGGCGGTVTVTALGPAVTVTVTAGSGSDSSPSSAPDSASPQSSAAGEAAASAASSAAPPFSSAAYNNGTQPLSKTRTKCKSTGFLTQPSASFTPSPTGTDPFPIVAATASVQAYGR